MAGVADRDCSRRSAAEARADARESVRVPSRDLLLVDSALAGARSPGRPTRRAAWPSAICTSRTSAPGATPKGGLIWGINDFDEACELPYTHDLVRLATSACLARRRTVSFRCRDRAMCEAILEGYGEGSAARRTSDRPGGTPHVRCATSRSASCAIPSIFWRQASDAAACARWRAARRCYGGASERRRRACGSAVASRASAVSAARGSSRSRTRPADSSPGKRRRGRRRRRRG